jgi:hypothetical protein
VKDELRHRDFLVWFTAAGNWPEALHRIYLAFVTGTLAPAFKSAWFIRCRGMAPLMTSGTPCRPACWARLHHTARTPVKTALTSTVLALGDPPGCRAWLTATGIHPSHAITRDMVWAVAANELKCKN